MAYEANSQVLARAGSRARARLRESEALREALRVFTLTRALVFAVAVFAALTLGVDTGGLAAHNSQLFDDPVLTHTAGGFGNIVLTPLARWDAVWYLQIANSGYASATYSTAFFPLYPFLVRGLGQLGGGSPGALLVASYVISLGAFLGALALLYKLVTLELGRPLASPTLLLLAFFPASLYFGAPYSESVFLLASVGAFYAARTGNWAWAGVAAAAAAASRSAGVLLVIPLAMLYLWGPCADRPGPGRHRLRPDAAWLLLGPFGLLAYVVYLQLVDGNGLSFLDVQAVWSRQFAGPFAGIWHGFVAAGEGARQLLSGGRHPVYFTRALGDPYRVAAMNLMLFCFLIFAVVACVGALRRLPRAYGVYMVAALALPLSSPVRAQPLMSLPRFLAVLFPIFMWLALVCEERRITDRAVAASAVVLGLFTAQFATWHFVA